MKYAFTLDGNPIPKARPRVVNGHAYTPRETRQAEQDIRTAAKLSGVRRLSGDIKLSVAFYRSSAHACDVDNLAKLVQDALNGIAYEDDRQIICLSALKTIDRARPRTEVEIEQVEWRAIPVDPWDAKGAA